MDRWTGKPKPIQKATRNRLGLFQDLLGVAYIGTSLLYPYTIKGVVYNSKIVVITRFLISVCEQNRATVYYIKKVVSLGQT